MASPPLFQRATVTRVVRETADARTFVLAPHEGPLSYQAGQFCNVKVHLDGEDLQRSYSMSSAPETDTELMTTVKRVPGGKVSNWLIDNVAEGDELEISRAHGLFVLRPADVPLLGLCGGSGITPILSLVKSTLASTDRRIRVLCADRDRAAAIFDDALADLAARHPDRLTVVRHLDADSGLLDKAAIRAFVGDDGEGDAYVCGPEAFMELVENSLPGPGRAFSERFGSVPNPTAAPSPAAVPVVVDAAPPAVEADQTVTIHLNRKRVTVPLHAGETLLETARRAGLAPPFSCEAGNCATCIATLKKGTATMRVNDALSDDEIDEGFVLTCQAVPDGTVTVKYE